MKKILVLGGTRYFRKKLVQLCLESGAHVTVGNRGLTKDDFGDRVKRLSFDRTTKGELSRALRGSEWDIVFDQYCYSSGEALEAVEFLNARVGKYIHTSTQSVYIKNGEVFEEDFDPYTRDSRSHRRENISEGHDTQERHKRRGEPIYRGRITIHEFISRRQTGPHASNS